MLKTFISLFGGIGGFDLALTEAGLECVGYYEIDKYAVQTYNKNFETNYYPRDITILEENAIPKHDILCAGFPCQSFSIAGKRRGFEDTRGTLFFEICRIAKYHRPKILFLENVRGLLSHDEGKTFETILNSLDELGYSIEWQILNSKHFNVPQNRERVFIIGHLRGFGRQQVFPIQTSNRKNNKIIVKSYIGGNSNNIERESNAVMGIEGISMTLTSQGGGNTSGRAIDLQNKLEKNKKRWGTHYLTEKSIHPTLCAIGESDIGNFIDNNKNIRRLTPTECERLQSFPDNWTKGVSESQRYKQLGNAVTVNVIRKIIQQILNPKDILLKNNQCNIDSWF